jgi:hypothetical protein
MLRRPPPNVPFSYPPKSVKSKKKKKKKGIKRRRKTNVKREVAFGERMTLPYRQKQTAQNFMSVHQQALLNQARDLQEANRKKQLEVEKASKEDLQLRRDTLELQKAQISNQEIRDNERQQLEQAKEVQRRQEVAEQRAEDRQRENRRLNEEQNKRLQEFQLKQQEIRLRNEEIQKARALQIDNQRNQDRLAREFLSRQNNQNRVLTDLFRGLSQEIQERQAVGERRQGELENRIQQEIRDVVNRGNTLPNLSIGEGARITMPTPVIQLNQPRSFPDPIPEVEELPSTSTAIPLRDRPSQRRARSMVEEARSGLNIPTLSEAEAQEVRDRIYGSLMNVGSRFASSRPILELEAPPQGDLDYSGITPPPRFTPSGASSVQLPPRRPDRDPEPLNLGDLQRLQSDTGLNYRGDSQIGNDALSTLRTEAQRLRDIATISSESQRQRNLRAFIDEGGDDDAVFVGSPRPDSPPPSLTPSPIQPEPEIGLGGQIAGAVGEGLSSVGKTAVGGLSNLAGGVATGVYDATIGQLPTATDVGQALGSGAVQGVSNVAKAVGGGLVSAISGGDLEPEPEQTEEEIRTQARLEEYDRLVNTNRNSTLKKQDPRGRMKLVILEDLPKNWYKNNRGNIPTKKGTYPIKNYGAGNSDINNTRGFNFFYPDGEREFALQLYQPERDKAFRRLIRDKKIKFVFDEPNI